MDACIPAKNWKCAILYQKKIFKIFKEKLNPPELPTAAKSFHVTLEYEDDGEFQRRTR